MKLGGTIAFWVKVLLAGLLLALVVYGYAKVKAWLSLGWSKLAGAAGKAGAAVVQTTANAAAGYSGVDPVTGHPVDSSGHPVSSAGRAMLVDPNNAQLDVWTDVPESTLTGGTVALDSSEPPSWVLGDFASGVQ